MRFDRPEFKMNLDLILDPLYVKSIKLHKMSKMTSFDLNLSIESDEEFEKYCQPPLDSVYSRTKNDRVK